ncbi:MAG: sigma-70 family RNA polymerase sigma factor [Planctomycetes bacterium]|nr:sigma-70 family RNA polymerase sigma factor [Planctomycetota bacterium]MCW8134964.1 sigma-70 family RNA polymerase sigma factor [Planctomycetota bacterium]
MISINTDLLGRLKKADAGAWYEMWDVFGPSIERMIGSIASRYFGQETIKDVSQETLARVYQEIGKFDPKRGAKFSTWLYAIAKHVVYSELTSRSAQKRGGGARPMSLDDTLHEVSTTAPPDAEFEAAVFRAKVYRALKEVEKTADFTEFECYRLRLTDGAQGKEISDKLGVSEASVSRYLKRVRDQLRQAVGQAVMGYSWTDDEKAEYKGSGLTNQDDDAFDAALSDIYLQDEQTRKDYGKLQKTARSVR